MNVDFILGEKKFIKFDVKSAINQRIVITSARYKLYLGDNLVAEDDCDIISDDCVQLLLKPDEVGKYVLEVEYEIPPEIRKVRCKINVY